MLWVKVLLLKIDLPVLRYSSPLPLTDPQKSRTGLQPSHLVNKTNEREILLRPAGLF
ncbi:hypothetical protein THTE_1962 [Thermogutta terrifontis]|uniref:Uncharacterized protein n=1 Tax=Thermogutta terrifontis TaxID=1331910 RepID=A0A286RF27_9BACT|nr:hypothetical protein THTE_1962 [Thermogutta terrifontis]